MGGIVGTLGVGVGIFPLIASTATTITTSTTATSIPVTVANNGIHLWQNQSNMYTQIDGVSGGGGGSGSGTTTCQDCGNQAKKDCRHRRCRTCCKSRGFDCNTHVKSTWVPAARRRERLTIAGGSNSSAGCSSGSTSGAKKPRLLVSHNTATSHASVSYTPPRSFESGSSHQDANLKETLPGQVRAPAVFKCVRVTAVDDGKDEFAYQAVVKIGGHVFKGLLYDQGVDNQDQEERVAVTASDHHNVAGSLFSNMSELHLGNSRIRDGSASNVLDPYAASAFGNQINLS